MQTRVAGLATIKANLKIERVLGADDRIPLGKVKAKRVDQHDKGAIV